MCRLQAPAPRGPALSQLIQTKSLGRNLERLLCCSLLTAQRRVSPEEPGVLAPSLPLVSLCFLCIQVQDCVFLCACVCGCVNICLMSACHYPRVCLSAGLKSEAAFFLYACESFVLFCSKH